LDSLLPESPRYLVSKDRDDEAFDVLVKYHAEGDAGSLLVKAEMAQIKSTIAIELEHSKSSWMDMVATAGMRRRVLIAGLLGLFTQMSGNTLLSYYQNLLYIMMGYTSTYAKTRINLANACWSLMTALVAAYAVARFRRRVMFMTSAGSMLITFICITISFEKLSEAKNGGYTNKAAGVAALVFYFAYAPCYAIGNNALTYSKS
jgi:Sugar (and other) transporter